MKYSFIVPYFRRPKHLFYTLLSYRRYYSDRKDYEILIGVDAGNTASDIGEMWAEVNKFKDMNIIVANSIHAFQTNPARIRNELVSISSGEYIINTNPECYHEVDILSGFDEEISRCIYNYIVCSCKSCFVDTPAETFEAIVPRFNIWYDHSEHNPRSLHWCTCINKTVYRDIGGFDGAYGDFIGYDDDDFVQNIKAHGILFVIRDDLCVVHVEHERLWVDGEERLLAGKKYFMNKWNYGEPPCA